MKLKEFEAKKLLQAVGIPLTQSTLITSPSAIPSFQGDYFLKLQTLAGGRGKAGGIIPIKNSEQAKTRCQQLLGHVFLNETIHEILLDKKIDVTREFYVGILFDTSRKCPLLIFSEEGGVDIEKVKASSPEKIIIREINYLHGLKEADISPILSSFYADKKIKSRLKEILSKLYACFVRFDCKMIEINPLAITPKNDLVALDAVAVLDDDAHYRREIQFPERTDTRKATPREIAAHQIDKDDYRGVAGKTFLDLDGDIAILTSGGGASMTIMDALMEYGGKPANFTEYSGDPPKEKVEKLTRIVLDCPHLSGLLIGGVIANFTNIAETLGGVLTVLQERKPDFPIVIRRAGPHDEEAKRMLLQAKKELGLDIHYFDEKMPLTQAVNVMIELSNQYKKQRGLAHVHSH
ncbi:acetate--CoA ligase family protein [Candidatus Woesearchaeota archaeon]|nr:acetate--CoA ligase family protein [Candidatus Woesearchaeota archaeon]